MRPGLEQGPLEVQLDISCKICSAEVEDAEHFISTCSSLAEDRCRLFNAVSNVSYPIQP